MSINFVEHSAARVNYYYPIKKLVRVVGVADLNYIHSKADNKADSKADSKAVESLAEMFLKYSFLFMT